MFRVRVDDEQVEPAITVEVQPADASAHHRHVVARAGGVAEGPLPETQPDLLSNVAQAGCDVAGRSREDPDALRGCRWLCGRIPLAHDREPPIRRRQLERPLEGERLNADQRHDGDGRALSRARLERDARAIDLAAGDAQRREGDAHDLPRGAGVEPRRHPFRGKDERLRHVARGGPGRLRRHDARSGGEADGDDQHRGCDRPREQQGPHDGASGRLRSADEHARRSVRSAGRTEGRRAAAGRRTRGRATPGRRPSLPTPSSGARSGARQTRPIATPKTRRALASSGTVFGSVIMKNRKTRISGENTRTRHSSAPMIGPRCQRAVIAWSVAASSAMPDAKTSQNADRDPQQMQSPQDREPADDDQREGEGEPR